MSYNHSGCTSHTLPSRSPYTSPPYSNAVHKHDHVRELPYTSCSHSASTSRRLPNRVPCRSPPARGDTHIHARARSVLRSARSRTSRRYAHARPPAYKSPPTPSAILRSRVFHGHGFPMCLRRKRRANDICHPASTPLQMYARVRSFLPRPRARYKRRSAQDSLSRRTDTTLLPRSFSYSNPFSVPRIDYTLIALKNNQNFTGRRIAPARKNFNVYFINARNAR